MTKEITSRMKLIAEMILSEKNVTLEDVSKTLKISSRQVRYDVSRINDYFEDASYPILETDNKGMFVINDIEKLNIISKSKEKNFKFSQKQRLHLLLVICAFNIEKMNLSQLSKEIHISRMTIKNDLELVKESLEQYHLKLEYDNQFYLTGDKKNVYEFQRDILYLIEYTLFKEEFEKNEILQQQYLIEGFNNVELRKILPIVHRLLETNHQTMTDSQLYWFACTVLLNIWYDINHQSSPKQSKTIQSQSYIDFSSFFNEIEVSFHVEISQESQNQINNHYHLICHEESDYRTIDLNIVIFIYGLLRYIHQHYQKTFVEDHFFLKSLYYHLEKSYRLQNIKMDIPHLEKYYTTLDTQLASLITQYCQENTIHGITIDKEDIDFIKLYVANLFYRKNEQVKKVLLICGASLNLKEQLSSQLESLFNLKIVKTISKYEIPFFEDWDMINVILFTEDIPSYFKKDIPTEHINMNLTFEDYFKLNQIGIVPHNHMIDFHELYHDLSFLNKEDQIHTFQILAHYLTGKVNLQALPSNQYSIHICHDFNENHYKTIEINPHFYLAFKNVQQEQISVYCDEMTNNVTFIIESYDPAKIIQLLLNYSQLEMMELWKLKNPQQIIDFVQDFIDHNH